MTKNPKFKQEKKQLNVKTPSSSTENGNGCFEYFSQVRFMFFQIYSCPPPKGTKIDNDSNATYRTATYIKLYHTSKCRALSCFSWKLWSSAVAVHYNCKAAFFPDTNFTVSIFGIKVLACSVHHVHSSRICTETRLRTEERCLLKRSSSDLIGYWNHRVQL